MNYYEETTNWIRNNKSLSALMLVVAILVITNIVTFRNVNIGFSSAKEWHEYELEYFAKLNHSHDHTHADSHSH